MTWARATSAGWLGDIITLGTTVSAFGCCLASTVGASRMIYAMARDAAASAAWQGVALVTPAAAALVI